MLNAYFAEWMKLKRSTVWWIVLGYAAIYLLNRILSTIIAVLALKYPVPEQALWFLQPVMIIFTLASQGILVPFAVAAYILSREHTDNMRSLLATYPQKQSTIYFSKMFVIGSVFAIWLAISLLNRDINVGDVHKYLVFIILTPLITLIGLPIRNLFLCLLIEVGFGWFLKTRIHWLQRQTSDFSPYNDTLLPMHDFSMAKIKHILYDYFFVIPLVQAWTIAFVAISLVSLFLIYWISNRQVFAR